MTWHSKCGKSFQTKTNKVSDTKFWHLRIQNYGKHHYRRFPPPPPLSIVFSGISVSSDVSSTWKCLFTICGFNTRAIYDVKWCNLTNLIACASGDNSIRVFKLNENGNDLDKPMYAQVACELNAHDQDCNSLAWNPKVAGLLASSSDDYSIKLWRVLSDWDFL